MGSMSVILKYRRRYPRPSSTVSKTQSKPDGVKPAKISTDPFDTGVLGDIGLAILPSIKDLPNGFRIGYYKGSWYAFDENGNRFWALS